MKNAEVREFTIEELRNKLNDAREELMNLRFQVVNGQLTDTSRLQVTRRLVAQYETHLRERELAAQKEGAK